MINTKNEVKIYEKDGKDTCFGDEYLVVENHWRHSNMIVLTINGVSITVSAEDLNCAIKNAVNVNRY